MDLVDVILGGLLGLSLFVAAFYGASRLPPMWRRLALLVVMVGGILLFMLAMLLIASTLSTTDS